MEVSFCRNCLLRDMDENEYFTNLYDYIDRIDGDLKAENEVYEKRLDICKNCDNLLNGMCKICGCFVELRAVMNKNCCPDINKYW